MKNSRLIDMKNKKIGFWLVGSQSGNSPRGAAMWNCVCECGNESIISGGDLRSGKSTNCGCKNVSRLGDFQRKHNGTGTRLYNAWRNMRSRCRNKNSSRFEHYGGRGISVCQEWSEYENFAAWALENGYDKTLSLERIDVNGDYEPSNCTWANAKTQASNRRFTKKAPDGELWWHKAQKNGITRPAFEWRKAQGWPIELIISHPMNVRRIPRERDKLGQFV